MQAAIRTVAVLLIAATFSCSAFAQRHATPAQVPRYAPQSPTVSPYLNLLNRNGGAAQNYFGLIRPLEHQQSINEQQQRQVAKQGQILEQQINKIRDEDQAFSQPKVKPTGTASWFQTTGQKSSFQAADHYYGQWQGTKKPQRRH